MNTVLIVDDSKTSRYMLRHILVENGYEVIGEAENGQEAVELLLKYHPDMLLLDMQMPLKNGMDVKMLDAIKLGAADFVTKPYETSQIISIMDSMKE